jgi:hypothetical protein
MISLRFILGLTLPVVIADSASAAITEFTNKAAWQSAAGSVTSITFQEFPVGTVVTNQYNYLGIQFTPGQVAESNEFTMYINDNVGLTNGVPISFNFDQPRQSVAFDYPGSLQIKLFSNGLLIYNSDIFGVGGPGLFAGIVSTQSFDAVTFSRGFGPSADVDDLHFGAPVPAPSSALLLLGFAALGRRRGRR